MLFMRWRMVNLLKQKELYNQENDTDVLDTDIDNDIQESASDINDSGNTPFIVCDGLVKIYKTDEVEVMALQGLELEVNRGEILSVIGKSGSGKSTLMNIIGGLERQSAGKIVVDGINLADMSEKEMVSYRKKKIGFVWQKSSRNLYSYLTSLENVEAAMNFSKIKGKSKRQRAMELLEMVGIDHKMNSYPSQMSGGEQQRVSIAVALANDPDILLADEPTGAVDSKTSNMIQDLFRKLNREIGLTIIIVTHDVKLANKVDRVVMISDGKISTEKIMKAQIREQIDSIESAELDDDSHEEYSVMDKAHRVQLNDEILEAAGIDTNKVKISVVDGKVIITGENS